MIQWTPMHRYYIPIYCYPALGFLYRGISEIWFVMDDFGNAVESGVSEVLCTFEGEH